ncbi:MAG TPA: TIGR02147 family protein [Fibrobacteria bacterium]|nr:TIGR02147 family protein [Fibrobacteria bacterium]
MDSLYATDDYRAWLKERYEERKRSNPHFSYRFMAQRVDMDPGHLVKVLQGRLHLSENKLGPIAKLFGLDARGERYLLALVRFAKAVRKEEVEARWEELQALKDVQTRELAQDQYDFYSSWIPTALRGLLSLEEADQSPSHLAGRLHPTPSETELSRALDLLIRLGLVETSDQGRLRIADKHIRTGDLWKEKTVRAFQRETLRLAEASLDDIPPRRRDVTTLTLTLAERDLGLLRERAAEFRRDLIRLAEESDPADSVYQVNIQIFPFTTPLDRPARKAKP